MSGGSRPELSHSEQLRPLVPGFALAVAVVAAVTDPSSAADLVLAALPVGAFAAWAYVRDVPLPALSLAVAGPVVVGQRSGQMEPLLFDVSLLGFVVGRWAPSPRAAIALGLLAAASPVVGSLIQEPSELAVGIWILGITFPWVLGRAAARQAQLATQLDATRRELAEQAVLAERRRIARDVHDFVGHGLAAVMLQVTSARHVLRRDPAAAEEALRSAEDVGRHSMRELRRTVALLRSDDEAAVAPPLPSAAEIPALVDHARAGPARRSRQRPQDPLLLARRRAGGDAEPLLGLDRARRDAPPGGQPRARRRAPARADAARARAPDRLAGAERAARPLRVQAGLRAAQRGVPRPDDRSGRDRAGGSCVVAAGARGDRAAGGRARAAADLRRVERRGAPVSRRRPDHGPDRRGPVGERAIDAVRELRDDLIPRAFAGVDAEVLVTGDTAEELDYHDTVDAWLLPVFAFVLG